MGKNNPPSKQTVTRDVSTETGLSLFCSNKEHPSTYFEFLDKKKT